MRDALCVVGMALVTAGSYQWYAPAGLIVAGVSIVVIAVVWGWVNASN